VEFGSPTDDQQPDVGRSTVLQVEAVLACCADPGGGAGSINAVAGRSGLPRQVKSNSPAVKPQQIIGQKLGVGLLIEGDDAPVREDHFQSALTSPHPVSRKERDAGGILFDGTFAVEPRLTFGE
jgi:hypothetical protein